MKKLSRITLAKTYDVLSENEMKKVVGGMGSGSGMSLPTCEDSRMRPYVCTIISTGYERGMACANSAAAAETAFCGDNQACKDDLTCI